MSNNKSEATYRGASPVVVMDSPDRETRPLAVGVTLTLFGHEALALGAAGWPGILAGLVLGAGIVTTGFGIARAGR